MNDRNNGYYERKTYYVSVQAGSILEDPTSTAYELVIEANEEELNRLQELFEELATMDEAEAFQFTRHPYGTAPIERISAGYDGFIEDIYRLLYQLGTPDTRAHIATMGLFPERSLT